MKKLTLEDILSQDEYERRREEFRRRIIGAKSVRRIEAGSLVSVVFENRDTALFQIQEMLRAEHIVEPAAVQMEIDSYNGLVPDAGELRATLFIEITDNERIKEFMDSFQGLDEPGRIHLALGAERVLAEFEPGRSKEDRISAVQYIGFHLNAAQAQELASSTTPPALVVDHPGYQYQVLLSDETKASLAHDLAEQ